MSAPNPAAPGAAPVPASPATRRAPLGPLAAALVLVLLMGLQPVTTDLMLVALPALATDLHAAMAPVQLTMSALILAFGIAQLAWGPVADRFGRRPVLLAGLSLYLLSALAAMLASDIAEVVAARVVQGAAMSAAVVCGRAMVRDLYEPQQGAQVMARALGGLGLIAIACPSVGGLLVAAAGWRAAVGAMAAVGGAALLYIAWRLPETIRERKPDATRLGPLLARTREILAHPGFRAWAALVAATYGGLFTFLAGSGFVLIRVLGFGAVVAGAIISLCSVAYIAGTFLARRWIRRRGLAGAVVRAARFSALACGLFALVAVFEPHDVVVLMAPMLIYALGHGVHQPCGQTGAVGPFPHAAGLASALAGFATAIAAFGVGLWLGRSLDGGIRPFAIVLATFAGLTALIALTAVRRHGDRVHG